MLKLGGSENTPPPIHDWQWGDMEEDGVGKATLNHFMRGVRAGLYYCSGWCSVPVEWAAPIYQEPGLNLASSPIYHNTSTNLFGKWEWSALSNAYLSPPICKLYRFTMHSLLQGHSFCKNMNIRGNPKTSRPDIYKRVQCGIIYQFVKFSVRKLSWVECFPPAVGF